MPYGAEGLPQSCPELDGSSTGLGGSLSSATGASPALSLACGCGPAPGCLSLRAEHSCVCLVHPEWHWGWNGDLSHETIWETKFPLSKLCHVSTSCSASNFYKRRRELSAETCQWPRAQITPPPQAIETKAKHLARQRLTPLPWCQATQAASSSRLLGAAQTGGAGSHLDRRQGRAGKPKKGHFHTEEHSRALKQAGACA